MTQKDENYLLQEICRNSGMGVAAINQVLKDVYDEEFAYELNVQADKMEQFARKAGIRLRENGSEPSEPKPIATAMLVTAIRMKQALQNRTEDVADLIGMEVLLENGEKFGVLRDVMETGANDVYIVDRVDGEEILLPAIHDCVLDVDVEKNTMTVHLMKGLV